MIIFGVLESPHIGRLEDWRAKFLSKAGRVVVITRKSRYFVNQLASIQSWIARLRHVNPPSCSYQIDLGRPPCQLLIEILLANP